MSDEQRRAEELWDAGREALAAGDHGTLRRLDDDILRLALGGAVEERARTERELLRIDPFALKVGLGTLVLYAGAWVFALI